MTYSLFLAAGYLRRCVSSNLREASTNNHNLAIPPHPKQGLDIDPLDYNYSIHLSYLFFYLVFCHP